MYRKINYCSSAKSIYLRIVKMEKREVDAWMGLISVVKEEVTLSPPAQKSNETLTILHRKALKSNPFSETILSSTLLHYESTSRLDLARGVLSRLRHYDVTKVWRTILVGAQIELRSGRLNISRQIFRYLRRHVGWYGPLHVLASGLESNYEGNFKEALRVLRRGAGVVPRYGPIALSGVRVAEQLCIVEEGERDGEIIVAAKEEKEEEGGEAITESTLMNSSEFLREARAMAEESIASISRELLWKVYFELGGVESRGVGRLDERVEVIRKGRRSRRGGKDLDESNGNGGDGGDREKIGIEEKLQRARIAYARGEGDGAKRRVIEGIGVGDEERSDEG